MNSYLIQVNGNFKILNQLLEMLDCKENDFFILIDQKVKQPYSSLVTYNPVYSHIYEVPRIVVNWAAYSSLKSEFNLLQFAYSHGKYDYYHYMQGSDFPIKSKEKINAFYEEHNGYEFISFSPRQYKEGCYKLNYHHFFGDNRYYRNCKLLHYMSHAIAKLEQKFWKGRYPNRTFYHGSALWSISESFCKYILDHLEEIDRQAKYTIAADEVLFQTIIVESPFKNNLYRFEQDGGNLYLIDWKKREGNSPYTFVEEDLDRLINAPEYYLYTRKVNEAKSQTLITKLMAANK